ncbi:MAG: methyltransferase domain-containing protein [Anaerolineae bacterium]
MINGSVLAFLFSPTAERVLQSLTEEDLRPEATLATLSRLRQHCSPEEAGAVLTLARLRRRARAKFSRADRMFFTEEALEQATGEVISGYRARRYRAFAHVLDLGCGIGGDTIGLARQGCQVIAIDRDEVRLRMALANAAANELGTHVKGILADLSHVPWQRRRWPASAAFVDPARREGGRRVFSLRQASPPLDAILAWREEVPHLGVKAHPGIDDHEIPQDCEVEFISERGTCKEAVLWFGDLRTGARRRATLLPGEHTLVADRDAPVPIRPPGHFLYEPDGAVIRAHLVETLARRLGAWKIDDEIAYLSSDEAVPTPFARCYPVWEVHPFGLKRLNARLRALQVGDVVVKKRGSPVDPEAFRRRLRVVPEGRPAVVVLTRSGGEPVMLICGEAL